MALVVWLIPVVAFADPAPRGLWALTTGIPLSRVDPISLELSSYCDIDLSSHGLVHDPVDDVFYASDFRADRIYRVDPRDCSVEPLRFELHSNALAIDPPGRRLWVASNHPGDDDLWEIDLERDEIRRLGDVGVNAVYSLVFHPRERKLYGVLRDTECCAETLERFDDLRDPAERTLVTDLDEQGVDLVQAMTFDPTSGSFLVSALNDPFRSLLSVDPGTGLATRIGRFQPPSNLTIYGLAFVDHAPPLGVVDLGVTPVGDAATLEWSIPESGGIPLEYVVEIGAGPGRTDFREVLGADQTTASYAGFPEGYYVFRVEARNAFGTSPPARVARWIPRPSACGEGSLAPALAMPLGLVLRRRRRSSPSRT